MTVMLDLIGSVIISGYVILIGLQLNMNTAGTESAISAQVNVQESLADYTSQVEADLKKIGFNVPDPRQAIIAADSNAISFRADLDRNGTLDSVRMYIGETKVGNQRTTNSSNSFIQWLISILRAFGFLRPEQNPQVSYGIYRTVNGGEPAKLAKQITKFQLKYYDDNGQPTTTPSQVAYIETNIGMASEYMVQSRVNPDSMVYVNSFWRQMRMATRNIKRHG